MIDTAPKLGTREYLSGARPIAGAVAACGLLLLACSWFAMAEGRMAPTRDVGKADPVRIDGTPSAVTGVNGEAAARTGHQGITAAVARSLRGAAGSSARRSHAVRIGSGRAEQSPAELPSPLAPRAQTHVEAAVVPRSSPPSPPPAATVETPALPAPLDELPDVTVPVPVPVPSVPVKPSVPDTPAVPDLTPSVGLP